MSAFDCSFDQMKEETPVKPSELLAKRFPHQPTTGQQTFFELMDDFLLDTERYRDCSVLKGYAGTGKTTIVSTLIKVSSKFGFKAILLAPTGRAAKVMTSYSKKVAQTIHKKIYKQVADAYTGNLQFERQKNYHENALFIVDEASMITNDSEFGSRGLLFDLIEFVFENVGNKLILVGDTAQLPPVGKDLSPALDKSYLETSFYLTVFEQELTEVMRQEEGSGILTNATALRNILSQEKPQIKMQTRGFRDFFKMTGDRLEDGLRYAYHKYGRENVIIITRSNKSAVQYNQYVRRQINAAEDELDTGDMLMIVRNNYTTIEETSPAGFLANGDFVEIKRIGRSEEIHGFRFATLELKLVDYEDQPPFEAKVLLDTLSSASPSLSSDDNKKLYESVMQDYQHLKSRKDRSEAVRKDPYLNALQVKFAYALTCHKSQGGQWPAVFIDQGFLPDDQLNKEFIRWLYTAVTRATHEVFLMNFHSQFFGA